jgi:hypothetical protein
MHKEKIIITEQSKDNYFFKNSRCKRTLKISDKVTFYFEGEKITKKIKGFDIDDSNQLIFYFNLISYNDERWNYVSSILY